MNNDVPKVVVIKWSFGFAFCFRQKILVSIGFSHSISRHGPCIPSQKFNICDFVASTQAFVAKAGIAREHWCLYIERHRVLLCILLCMETSQLGANGSCLFLL